MLYPDATVYVVGKPLSSQPVMVSTPPPEGGEEGESDWATEEEEVGTGKV